MTAVYHWRAEGASLSKFERRTTLCSALNEENAEALLLEEAESYETSLIKMLDDYVIRQIDGRPGSEPVEVASEIELGVELDSGQEITPDDFIRKHWNVSRIKSCDSIGVEHSWYNKDGATSACYNCEQVREGSFREDSKVIKPLE